MPSWTTPRTWATSETVTAALLNTHLRDDLQYLYDLFNNAWASFTPTLGGTSASLGNGTLVCHYARAGKLVFARYVILGGSTTNLSSDILTLTLPVTARDPGDYRQSIGTGLVVDAGVNTWSTVAIIDHATYTSNDKFFLAVPTAPTSAVNDTNPIAGGFAASDQCTVNICYEAA